MRMVRVCHSPCICTVRANAPFLRDPDPRQTHRASIGLVVRLLTSVDLISLRLLCVLEEHSESIERTRVWMTQRREGDETEVDTVYRLIQQELWRSGVNVTMMSTQEQILTFAGVTTLRLQCFGQYYFVQRKRPVIAT